MRYRIVIMAETEVRKAVDIKSTKMRPNTYEKVSIQVNNMYI